LLRDAGGAAKACLPLYKLAFDRWCAELKPPDTVWSDVRTQGRLIVGLGGKGVLETGLTLHHTYGVPYIPGSGLKGLTSHYGREVGGLDDEHHTYLFGRTDDSGRVVFHDAWIAPVSVEDGCLAPDVMTPHHGGYYMEGKAPLDNDRPVPVSYLSVTGDFHLAVTCPGWPEGAEIAMNLLLEALANWGAGGKTSSGYGRMHVTGKP
jgi:CRISPR-associated protein Cmr6